MVYKKFIEIGTVVYINLGPHAGKLAAIVNVVDQNRLLVNGPCSKVPRCVVNLKQIKITQFRIKMPFGARAGVVGKAWEKANINALWAETKWAKKIESKAKKASLSDYDRYKLMKIRQKRSKIIAAEVRRLKKSAKSQ
ncbi:large ribosomal subunit protein eL14 [Ciona intestinalis]